MSLTEGEAVFFSHEEPICRMLTALFGVSGTEVSSVIPKLRIADADDADCVGRCLDASKRDSIPVLLYSEHPELISLPEGIRIRCLRRPFLLEEMYRTADLLQMESDSLHTPEDTLERDISARSEQRIAWNLTRRELVYGDVRVYLTQREAAVFHALWKASPAAVTREQLASLFSHCEGNAVDVYICYLRKKIAKLPVPAAIVPVRGQGYAWLVPEPIE